MRDNEVIFNLSFCTISVAMKAFPVNAVCIYYQLMKVGISCPNAPN